MHSMVGAFAPYTIKRRRVEIVRGYCYRFIQCSFPCGIIMLIISLLFIIIGASQLIYIFHFNGCNTIKIVDSESSTTDIISTSSSSSSSFTCNRQTMKVLGITFIVSGSVLFIISLLVTKYSRSSEENNVIRTTTTTTTSIIPNNTKHNHQHHLHYPHPILLSEHDQNHVIVSIK